MKSTIKVVLLTSAGVFLAGLAMNAMRNIPIVRDAVKGFDA